MKTVARNPPGSSPVARQHYIAGKAPGLVLLMEGYIAIVRQIAGHQVAADGIEQLRTALKVFAR